MRESESDMNEPGTPVQALFEKKVKVICMIESESDMIPVQALQNRLALPRRACCQSHQVVVVYIHPLP